MIWIWISDLRSLGWFSLWTGSRVWVWGKIVQEKWSEVMCRGTWRWPKGPQLWEFLGAWSSLRVSSPGRCTASSGVYIVRKECKRTTVREASYSSHHTRLMSSGSVNIRYWLFSDPISLPVLQEIMEHDGTLMIEKYEIVSINALLRDTS